MAYIPHTEKNRQDMLAAIGVEKLDDLYDTIPEGFRFPDLDLPGPLSEMEMMEELQFLSEMNVDSRQFACFLGAGAYNHYTPSVVDHILRRNEFYTAYTPYQPEISQGTLQTIFEYQSMICQLTGMDVSNASHYDGATSLAEAVIMALNQFRFKRTKIVFSPTIHPQFRQVVHTYFPVGNVTFLGEDQDPAKQDLVSLVDDQTAMVAVQYPDFLGTIEDFTALGDAVHAAGALFCVVVNPLALGMLKPPSEFGADIVVGEGQALGLPLSFGGPYLGIFATRDKYVRKMAGRLVGETVDGSGKRGYVLTLTPREQHIRREKATSNICSNQGLMVLAAAVYMSVMGRKGLREVAELNYHKAHYAASQIQALEGFSVWNSGKFFNEFLVSCPQPVAELNDYLMDYDILGGYDVEKDYPALKNHMLVAVTEKNSREDIEDFVAALKEVTHA
ncbi:MAG: aminomethyl-transferring glycine dehydrogenase subunit GcvPA [Anaerolineales bacterium]|nr:aminomethyl-transferring glycine dehydrogenase subunit GcvPA [Anaerolineales bacterium]